MPRPEWSEAAEQLLRERAKTELRQRMRALRRVMPAESCAQRSRALCDRLCALPEFARATTVVGYAAFRKEADPTLALRAAERAGKTVGLVRIGDDGALDIHRYREGDALIENAYGIAEPSRDAPRIAAADVGLILVPALAVDGRGQRIGYGEGYYDRLLPGVPRAFKVATTYDFQVLLEIPDAAHDVAVDCVVTDARTLRVEGAAFDDAP
jgi:5-formyltetrahydrofolate cyclo-ligase